jgi:hypothetical protein
MKLNKILLSLVLLVTVFLIGCGLSSSSSGTAVTPTTQSVSNQAVRAAFQATPEATPQSVAADFSFSATDDHSTYADILN